MRLGSRSYVWLLAGLVAGCNGEVLDPGEADETTEAGTDGEPRSCVYASPFTSAVECRDYTGGGWTDDTVVEACGQLSGDYAEERCTEVNVLGRCTLDAGDPLELDIVAYGTTTETCADQQVGCEDFGGGVWAPELICEGAGGTDGGDVDDPFQWPTLECRDPLPGEPPGTSEGGKVCTWQAISACTEPGRDFRDYASCDVVYTQRPYYASPPNTAEPADDPRMDDPAYVEELEWVRTQILASACPCCHSSEAPQGTAKWDVHAPGNFMHTFYDSGIAFGAHWIDSTSFGAYPPEENNGFDRRYGLPSTDPERMRAFFAEEGAYRGLSEADFEDAVPFGGPLYSQLVYEPEECAEGEGVLSDGTIRWVGGTARYVYVLAAGAANPTVPPNLDLPDATLWRMDVPHMNGPVRSEEVFFGEVPEGTVQRFPLDDAPPNALEAGNEYYLYVSKDVAQPITRCLFTFE